jgi:hypothetical protein
MNKKTILIGLGVLAVAGIGYYMWKKKSETTSGACGCSSADGEEEETNGEEESTDEEEKSNAVSYANAYVKSPYSPCRLGYYETTGQSGTKWCLHAKSNPRGSGGSMTRG